METDIYTKAKDFFRKYENSYTGDSDTYSNLFGEEEILLNRDDLLRSLLILVKIDKSSIDKIESNWIDKEKKRYDEMKDEIWSN